MTKWRISGNTLKSTSDALVTDLICNHVQNHSHVELRPNAEDIKPTEMMSYWVCTGKLPDPAEWEEDSNRHAESWTRAWLIGNGFTLVQFLNEVTLRLLKWCQGHNLNMVVADLPYRTAEADAAMRILIGEEVAWTHENTEEMF